MNIAMVGLDIARQFFKVYGVDPTGQVVLPGAPRSVFERGSWV